MAESGPEPPEPPPPPEPEWPDHFPPDCPDDTAAPVNGMVYRFVAGPEDWKCAAERDRFKKEPPCIRAALSAYLDFDWIKYLRTQTGPHKDDPIVAADLRPQHGAIKLYGKPRHYSLWLRRAALERRDELFSVVLK